MSKVETVSGAAAGASPSPAQARNISNGCAASGATG